LKTEIILASFLSNDPTNQGLKQKLTTSTKKNPAEFLSNDPTNQGLKPTKDQ